MMNRFVFAVSMLLASAFVFAAPDTLSVPVGNSSDLSLTGIWWPKSTNVKKSQKAKRVNAVHSNDAQTPVVVWFHGGMGSGNCAKGLVAGSSFAELYPEKIVVSLSACRENHWVTKGMVDAVDAALDSVAARRKSSVERVSLVGVSDGSLGVLIYSLEGRRSVDDRLLVSSFGKLLGEARAIAGANDARMRLGRWRFLQGGKDRLYPSEQTVPWIESFCGGVQSDCALRFDPEGEHDWSYWKGKHLEWIREATP
jgi:pimeloyl-ACP methyl ester carboxylesterase